MKKPTNWRAALLLRGSVYSVHKQYGGDMMYEELNRKLAEFAGFTYDIFIYQRHWKAPDGSSMEELPNFTSSLDACFKWLVPAVGRSKDIEAERRQMVGNLLMSWARDVAFLGEEPALALCLAIEKLIDGGD